MGVCLQAQKFINAYSAFLKRQGKLPIPGMLSRYIAFELFLMLTVVRLGRHRQDRSRQGAPPAGH